VREVSDRAILEGLSAFADVEHADEAGV